MNASPNWVIIASAFFWISDILSERGSGSCAGAAASLRSKRILIDYPNVNKLHYLLYHNTRSFIELFNEFIKFWSHLMQLTPVFVIIIPLCIQIFHIILLLLNPSVVLEVMNALFSLIG